MALLLVALASIACAGALYPDVQFYDSGELATASVYLGLGHGPGQPLYCMLSHAFLWIPFGSLAFRLCLFSAACTVLSLLVLQAILFDSVARSRAERLLVTLALACFPLHAFVHEQAGRVELYSLQMLRCIGGWPVCRSEPRGPGGSLGRLAAGTLAAAR